MLEVVVLGITGAVLGFAVALFGTANPELMRRGNWTARDLVRWIRPMSFIVFSSYAFSLPNDLFWLGTWWDTLLLPFLPFVTLCLALWLGSRYLPKSRYAKVPPHLLESWAWAIVALVFLLLSQFARTLVEAGCGDDWRCYEMVKHFSPLI